MATKKVNPSKVVVIPRPPSFSTPQKPDEIPAQATFRQDDTVPSAPQQESPASSAHPAGSRPCAEKK